MPISHQHYQRITWGVAIALAATIFILRSFVLDSLPTCCHSNKLSTQATENTLPSAVVTPIEGVFSFRATADTFSTEGETRSISWLNQAQQLQRLLSKIDQGELTGDANNATLDGKTTNKRLKENQYLAIKTLLGDSLHIENNIKVIPPSAPQQTKSASEQITLPQTTVLYFAYASSKLPISTEDSLNPVLQWIKQNPTATVVISGFHDASGDLNKNKRLAKRRAEAVKRYLIQAGADPQRIVLQKPQETTGTGDPAQARRVEVSVMP